jgi:hypothetical protein
MKIFRDLHRDILPWAQLFVEIDFRGVNLRITVWQAKEAKCFSVAFVVGVHWVNGLVFERNQYLMSPSRLSFTFFVLSSLLPLLNRSL